MDHRFPPNQPIAMLHSSGQEVRVQPKDIPNMATITITLTKEQKTKVPAQHVLIPSPFTSQTIQTFMLSLQLMPQLYSMDLSRLSTIMILESLLITA